MLALSLLFTHMLVCMLVFTHECRLKTLVHSKHFIIGLDFRSYLPMRLD